jgi:hypothetical protein
MSKEINLMLSTYAKILRQVIMVFLKVFLFVVVVVVVVVRNPFFVENVVVKNLILWLKNVSVT